ncbi:STE20-related kinase adapter protein alpha [Oryzias melastigma]|uniref:STE20-related kinase adapter protein alpha n=1 Tax=Oryzias melastigma TaxID=30732 RepID=A0A834KY80_ORYME|nr:STE20-related kinase adapter protein alpha [Oryzias melastigma]
MRDQLNVGVSSKGRDTAHEDSRDSLTPRLHQDTMGSSFLTATSVPSSQYFTLQTVFIAENELWVITPFMAYGFGPRSHLRSNFVDGTERADHRVYSARHAESAGIHHHMGYVHRYAAGARDAILQICG